MSKAADHAKTMLETYAGALKRVPAKNQAVAIEFKRAIARINANQELSLEGKANEIAKAKQKRDQQTAAIRQDVADAKDGMDHQLATLRRAGLEEGDGNAKLLGEMQLSRSWERVKPRLQRAANDPKRTAFDVVANVIAEAKAGKDRVTLNALREELPAFLDHLEPATDKQSRKLSLEAIALQLDTAEAELSPDFDLARRTAAEMTRGYGVIHQSLNTIEADDPSSIRVFDWPDAAGKVAQLAVE